MSMMMRNFDGRIEDHQALADMAALHGRVERKLYAALKSGGVFTGGLARTFYQQFGISAKTLDGIHRELKGKLKSVTEAAKVQGKDLEFSIAAKQKQIASVQRKIRKTKVTSGPLFRALHQHKRRLGTLEFKLSQAKKRVEDPALCFGSRKLFSAQHHLKENGYRRHQQWLWDWRATRSSQFFLEGDAQQPSGNAFAFLAARADGAFDLELRLPKALAHRAEQHRVLRGKRDFYLIDICGVRFPHGADEIRKVLAAPEDARQPLTYRFRQREDGTWTVSVMIGQEFVEARGNFALGALGIDLNEDHVAATLADVSGNPVKTWRFDVEAYGKTAGQRQDMVRKAAAKVAELAIEHRVPVVAEKLNFQRKRAELRKADGAKYARMLSSFACKAFGEALERVCARKAVRLVLVNPAYTSIIGRMKFAPRYGLSGHAAAALTIARRAMALSERLPSPCGVLLADGARVTLPRPARNARRHVWSSWSGLLNGLSAVHAGRSRARWKARSDDASRRKMAGVVVTGKGLAAAPRLPGGAIPPAQRGPRIDLAASHVAKR